MAFVDKLAFEASAGSGKTFNLVVRYLSLLFMGANPNKILALTFTNKAAAEMQERIIETLQKLESKYELEVIAETTAISRSEILADKERVLYNFLSSDAKIYTIDKFFAKILRKFALHVGIMPDFATFASQHEIKLMVRFFNEASVAGAEKSLIQLALMSAKRVSDIFLLLDELYIKSKEMPSSWNFQKSDYFIYEKEAFEALAELAKIVNSCKNASASAKKAVNIEEFEQLVKATWLQKESAQEYSYFKKCYTPEMDRALYKIQDAVLKRIRAYEQNFFYELMQLLSIYIKSKEAIAKEDAELSFDDIITLVYKLLREENSVDSDFLYFRLDSEIEHILLDEFQDTSILQYEILKPIMNEVTSGVGTSEKRSLFFVGDVKQSIYRFRGGVSALFHHVAKQYGVEVRPLVTNYRSDRAVVNFVNEVFRNKINNYKDQKVKEGANEGYVKICKSDEVLLQMYEHIKILLSQGASKNSIAILSATNGDGQSAADFLKEKGIDVVTETTSKLIAQKKVKALLEYFKYCYFEEQIYKRNFFALISQEESSLQIYDNKKYSLIEIAKFVIDKFELFSQDMNVIRFMERLSHFKDIEQLLFDYERVDDVATQVDVEGVRILTVHKSKGLEFEHVVLIDRLKDAPIPRAPIIYEYDEINLKNIYLRISSRSSFDKQYALALEKEAKLVREDTLNALYVACTRAEKSLYIIEKSKDSYFSLLNLEGKEIGTLEVIAERKKVEKKRETVKFNNLYYGTQSEILALQKEEESELSAIEFGNAMHYMLEMMSSFESASLQGAYRLMQNSFSTKLDANEMEDIYSRVERLVRDKEFLALVEGKHFKEQGISYKKELRYLDLLVEKSDGSYVIIDYKSSTSFASEHLKQVSFYKYIVENITHKSVEAYLCYLLDNGITLQKV